LGKSFAFPCLRNCQWKSHLYAPTTLQAPALRTPYVRPFAAPTAPWMTPPAVAPTTPVAPNVSSPPKISPKIPPSSAPTPNPVMAPFTIDLTTLSPALGPQYFCTAHFIAATICCLLLGVIKRWTARHRVKRTCRGERRNRTPPVVDESHV